MGGPRLSKEASVSSKSPSGSGTMKDKDLDSEANPERLDTRGRKGMPIKLFANHFRWKRPPSWALHKYSAVFSGEEHYQKSTRKKLFRKAILEHNEDVVYLYNGLNVFTSKRFEEHGVPSEMTVWDDPESDVSIKLTYIGTADPADSAHNSLLQLLFRTGCKGLEMVEMDRAFFDPYAAIQLKDQGVEVWPGFIPSMKVIGGEYFLSLDVTHKILRMDTVLQVIHGIENKRDKKNPAKLAKTIAAVYDEVKGTVVMTTYNKKTYHIDDIDYWPSPTSTFRMNGTEVSYASYYRDRYGVTVKDRSQPLLVCLPRKKDIQAGNHQPIMLVPELCQFIGLTPSMRKNTKLMDDLSKYLNQVPQDKVALIQGFIQGFRETASIQKDFQAWGLELDDTLVNLSGRVYSNSEVTFAKGIHPVGKSPTFTTSYHAPKMLSVVHLESWAVILPETAAEGWKDLMRILTMTAQSMKMTIAQPQQMIILPNARTQTYFRYMKHAIEIQPRMQLMFIILPNSRSDLYGHVKKWLAVKYGIPSQCFRSKTLRSPTPHTIVTRLLDQINVKLGGVPWSVNLPLKDAMFVGFNLCKGAERSVGAMVATISSGFGRYYSSTFFSKDAREIATKFQNALKESLLAYQEENDGQFPLKIIIYRDGLGEGQAGRNDNAELDGIKEMLAELYASHETLPPFLTYILINRRTNTRLFEMTFPSTYENPPQGTVVDSVVTLPDRYDFYLLSSESQQGTVTPCYYNILFDDSEMGADGIQLMTYKMCYMYYNYSGTIGVPAPYRYARKLAHFTGGTLGESAHENLSKRLHFL